MSAIAFESVSVRFPGLARPAVEGVTARVASGEFVVLLGTSGSGKTTLLKTANRLCEVADGRVLVGDRDVRDRSPVALRRQIGYVIQQVGLFPHMTVAENVAVVPKLLGWRRSRYQARTDELLHLVGLPPEDYRRRYPAQLSGGQQQRVGIARALAGEPRLLLMDEPFGALDAITRRGLQDELLRLQRRLGVTVLFVSHDVEEALRLADRVAALDRGRLVQFDAPLQLLTRPASPFVRELLGADDALRQLGALPAGRALARPAADPVRVRKASPKEIASPEETRAGSPLANGPDRAPAVDARDSARSALSLLLKTGADRVRVLDGDRPVGVLTLANLRQLACGGLGDRVSGDRGAGSGDWQPE